MIKKRLKMIKILINMIKNDQKWMKVECLETHLIFKILRLDFYLILKSDKNGKK
tara:strand:- start:164 stop:325 length:162 start_codon:yes stop_codon:yes gene_type:complete